MNERPTKLSDEAYRELRSGETYHPIVPASESPFEVTVRSVAVGLVMAMIFSLASAYLALKTGQGMEAAIPIAIVAIGLAGMFSRRSTILENVIIQSIGAASSAVVAGAVFTIPALYMLDIEVSFWHIFLTAFFGGCLGVLFLIPLRDYLMVREHGKLPFPEAMATFFEGGRMCTAGASVTRDGTPRTAPACIGWWAQGTSSSTWASPCG